MKFPAKFLAASMVLASVIVAPATAQTYSVESGTTMPVRLSKPASSVVIGNQNIADVAVADSQLVFLTGKSFGTTNLLILDADNNIMVSADVAVTADSANMVTVNRGGASYTYDCASDCRDSPVIGDDESHFAKALGQAEQTRSLNEAR